jgi:exosortase
LHTQSAAEPVSIAKPGTADRSTTGIARFLALLPVAALWFVCCRYLSAEWTFNEQYNYGWFVPFFAAYLFWLRWEDRPEAEISDQGSAFGKLVAILSIAGSALILLPLRVFEIGSADWRPLGWIHVAAAATITLSLIYLAGGWSWLRHFSFPVLFFFVAVPWPSPIETPIVQTLMRGIAASAAELLALFGIPAEVQGNLIRLPNGIVGVNEACSGVRSLQTSLTIGLLFGELKRLRVSGRILLIAAALAIALLANLLRATFLVWIASSRDITAVHRWHDIAGYAIVGLVFAGTMWIASRFRAGNAGLESKVSRSFSVFADRRSLITIGIGLLVWIVAVELGGEFWYRLHERDLIVRPGWTVRWPEKEPDFREIKIDSEVRNLMRFDFGREVAWTSQIESEGPTSRAINYLFFFRWNPGSGTILRARAHRPDICLPAAGWSQVGQDRIENVTVGPGRSLPFHRFEFVKSNGGGKPLRATAFFTLHEDVAHETENSVDAAAGLYSNWDWPDRWRVVRNGIRNRGQQVLEFIVINPANTDSNQAEQQFNSLVPHVVEPEKKN